MKTLLRTDEVAEYLGLSPGTLRFWRYIGRGPRYLKVGTAVRYNHADILEWLDQRVVEPEAAKSKEQEEGCEQK